MGRPHDISARLRLPECMEIGANIVDKEGRGWAYEPDEIIFDAIAGGTRTLDLLVVLENTGEFAVTER